MTDSFPQLSDNANVILDVARIFRGIGHKLELFNAFSENESATGQVMEASLDVHLEILGLYTYAIKHFRKDDMFGRFYLLLLIQ